jgi:hypothetical protein
MPDMAFPRITQILGFSKNHPGSWVLPESGRLMAFAKTDQRQPAASA